MIADPSRLTRGLLELQKLFDADVVSVKFERAFLNAAGMDSDDADQPVSGPLPFVPRPEEILAAAGNMLDATGRIAAEVRRRLPIVAVIPGSAQLIAPGEDHGPLSLALRALTEAACKAGANIVLFDGGQNGDVPAGFARTVSPAANIARYFSAAVIVSDWPDVPKSVADAVLSSSLPEGAVTLGRRVGLRCNLADLAGTESRALTFASGGGVPFLSFDDADVRGLTVEAIQAAFDQLRSIKADVSGDK